MKIGSLVLASGIAGAITAVIVAITGWLVLSLPFDAGPIVNVCVCGLFPVLLCEVGAGGLIGIWLYRRLEGALAGQGALVGGVGGSLAGVFLILLVIVTLLTGVLGAIPDGMPLSEAIGAAGEWGSGLLELLAQGSDLGVAGVVFRLASRVLLAVAVYVAIFALLGAIGGLLGAAIFQRSAPADSGPGGDERVTQVDDAVPAGGGKG